MDLTKDNLFICNCEKTMDIDGKKISNSCGLKNEVNIYNSLCKNELDTFSNLTRNSENKEFLICCTQEKEVLNQTNPNPEEKIFNFLNIRETAGWSKDSKNSSAKISALIKSASLSAPLTNSISLVSEGRCLIYCEDETGIMMGKNLSTHLGVTVMLSNYDENILADNFVSCISRGKITQASGSFSDFKILLDNFSEANPNSKSTIEFSEYANNVESSCDIIIDLTSNPPLFPGHKKRDGYFKVDKNDKIGLKDTETKAIQLFGEFEKPIYVNYTENICAHSRNKITGCTKCLDACPAGAINSNGDHVQIDLGICGGCGMCGAVCPSGAAQTSYPKIEDTLQQIINLYKYFQNAGGKSPHLLLHDGKFGVEMISLLARHSNGLPSNLIPFEIHSLGRVGHDILIGIIASGFEKVFILLDPSKSDESATIREQITLCNELLDGVNVSSADRVVLIEETDPTKTEDIIWKKDKLSGFKNKDFIPLGSPKSIVRTALKSLEQVNKSKSNIIPLSHGSPYGKIKVDEENCTLCLSCVGACPANALQDNPDSPQLLFREDACIQCGICSKTCPEKVIELLPQFNLSDDAMSAKLILEDEPFACKKCNKNFGTKKSIEKIISKLEEHTMFKSDNSTSMLELCENCRVEVMFDKKNEYLSMGQRPLPRTTDDYKK